MTPDRSAALLALVEASNALHLAHTALTSVGATEQAEEVHRKAQHVLAVIGKLTVRRVESAVLS